MKKHNWKVTSVRGHRRTMFYIRCEDCETTIKEPSNMVGFRLGLLRELEDCDTIMEKKAIKLAEEAAKRMLK